MYHTRCTVYLASSQLAPLLAPSRHPGFDLLILISIIQIICIEAPAAVLGELGLGARQAWSKSQMGRGAKKL